MPARPLIKNVSWLTLGNGLAKPIWLAFITLACVRVLGDEGYGILTATLFLTAITRSISDLGISQYSIREVARRRSDASRYFSNFLPAKVVLTLVAVGTALGIGYVIGYRGEKLTALLLAGAYTFGLSILDYSRCYFRAFEEMRYEAVSVVIEKALVVGIGLTFLLVFRSVSSALGGMAIGMAITALIALRFTSTHVTHFRLSDVNIDFIRSALPAAIPLGLAAQFVVIYFRADAVMVDAISGEAAAGQYGAAYRLLEAFMLISTLVTTVVYPRLSALFHQKRSQEFASILGWSIAAVTAIGVVVAAGLFIFADAIMLILKGDDSFLPAAGALRILAFVTPFMCINGLLSISMSASDDQRMLAVFLGIAATMNITLNFVLIPEMSFIGAAIATLVTEALITVAFLIRYMIHTKPLVNRLSARC